MKLKITNPANNQLIDEIEMDDLDSIKVKYNQAKLAQKKWQKVSVSEKINIIKKFNQLINENLEDLSKTLTFEVGKPISQSKGELNALQSRIDYFINETETNIVDESVYSEPGLEEIIKHEPLGVIANISAWNYPYFVGSNVFIPALLTGNSVLYKPSELASLTGLKIANLLYEAGIPKDVFIPIIGDGLVGKNLLGQKIDGVFFTGSYNTGKKIAEQTAGRFMKIQLELGGKDPLYVCDDISDIKSVAEGVADGVYYNTGQGCCSVERLYIHENIYDSFLEHFCNTVDSFNKNEVMDNSAYIGAMTRGKVHLDHLEKQVNDAIKQGAKLLKGGKRRRSEGFFFEPTVLVNVNSEMDIMKTESFGPVIGIQKVKSDQEAIQLMNDTEYGLTASVYSKDKTRAEAIMNELDTGSVYWNCCDRISPRLPWSGRKNSGIGLTLSKYGIQTFTKPKAFHLKKLS